MASKHPHYWKMKAAFLEQQRVEMQARAAQQQALAKLHQVMKECGLNPSADYNLNDAAETITEAKRKK